MPKIILRINVVFFLRGNEYDPYKFFPVRGQASTIEILCIFLCT